MSSRKSNNGKSSSGVSYAAGSTTGAADNLNVFYSQEIDPSRLLLKNGGFNGNPVEVYADGAVWDTVANAYLFPGRDFNPQDINRK
jgi:hypothetical protein